jgi:hypothetical protein
MSRIADKLIKDKAASAYDDGSPFDTAIVVGRGGSRVSTLDISNPSASPFPADLDDAGLGFGPNLITYNGSNIDRTNKVVISGDSNDYICATDFSDPTNVVSTAIYRDATVLDTPRGGCGIDETRQIAWFISATPNALVGIDYSDTSTNGGSVAATKSLSVQCWGLTYDAPNQIVYITSANLMFAFDVSNLSNITQVGGISNSLIAACRELAIDPVTETLYGAVQNGGIVAIDISDPSNMSVLSRNTSGSFNFCCVVDPTIEYAFGVSAYGNIYSYDVSNPSSMTLDDTFTDSTIPTASSYYRSLAIDTDQKLLYYKGYNTSSYDMVIISYADPTNLVKINSVSAGQPMKVLLFNR